MLLCSAAVTLSAPSAHAQQTSEPAPAQVAYSSSADAFASLPDAPEPAAPQTSSTAARPSGAAVANPQNEAGVRTQPKRILGLMPNYRAVSAGVKPPPPTSRQAFKIATGNSFDYSSFVFVSITSALAEGEDSHPKLGKGIPGFWAYSWRGFVDKTDGNYLVIWALPTVLHEDERYYAKGTGPKLHRAIYAATRVLITPDYNGHNTVNAAELLGRAGAQAISTTYYPSSDRTLSTVSQKYAYAIGRDALTNTFREFWPDIATHVLHRHP